MFCNLIRLLQYIIILASIKLHNISKNLRGIFFSLEINDVNFFFLTKTDKIFKKIEKIRNIMYVFRFKQKLNYTLMI